MNILGHGCSYTRLEEIYTALTMEKLESAEGAGVPLPKSIHPSVPTVLAFDNIDRQEVLSGAGTSHRVNGIIVQPVSSSCDPPPPVTSVQKKDKKRTITPLELPLPLYVLGKKQNPPPIVPADLHPTLATEQLSARQRNSLWIMVRASNTGEQTTSSWTGFNILTRDDKEVNADTVGYLPTINAPATESSTVQEVLQQTISIKSSLHLENIAIVFDQALFAKATEIAWRYPERFGNIVLMMGNFHTICNFMSILGKMFGEAGLRDLAVESGVIAEGSIGRVLEGKQYNRAVRLHKLTYEALMRLAWLGFEDWLERNHDDHRPSLDNTMCLVDELRENPSHATHDVALTSESCTLILGLFDTYLDVLRHDRGPLAAFWMTYVEMIELLLGLLRADREGNWYLHLSCIRDVLPWCFAMDKTNYARYLPVYYAQMSRLQETSPDLHDHFRNGGFSVQLSNTNPFAKIAVDQTTEETVNKDTQTAGGTRGFSLKPGAVARYYLTAEHRASALRELRHQISSQIPGKVSHPDLGKARIKRDESDVASLVDLMDNNWTNPFGSDPSDLVSISTGAVATPEVSSDLLTAHKQGEEAYTEFQEQRLQRGEGFHDPIKKLKVKTFNDMKKKSTKGSTKETALKADRKLFGNMVLIAQHRQLEMRDVLCHPLGPLPWALANADGTMKKTNKAVLSKHLETKVSPAEEIPRPSATLIDAMALIQKFHGENRTFNELSDQIFAQMMHASEGSERIDVVFDVYHDQSIKAAERAHRGSEDGVAFTKIMAGHKIHNWRRLLACTDSKTKLNTFLAENWKEQEKREKLGSRTMFVTCGNICIKLTSEGWQEVDDLKSNQEEADTRIFLHAKHAADYYPTLIVVTEDTDVFIICLALSGDINSNMYIRRGTKASIRLVNITKLSAALGRDVCTALIGLHPWTGCDTVSALAGQGKLKALKLLQRHEKFRETFGSLGHSWDLTNEIFNAIQDFTCQLYCRNTKTSEVNELRYQMFRSRSGEIESGQLPPCEDTLRQHTLRSNYQAAIWRRSLINSPDIPLPSAGHGWTATGNGIPVVKWMTGSPAPEIVLSLLSCKCGRSCRPAQCTCIDNGFKCTEACKLMTCSNMAIDEEELRQDEVLSSDSDDD